MIHLLHGAVGSPADWESFIPLLGDHPTRTIDLYRDDVLPFESMARKLNVEAAVGDVLVGYSMGGRLALHALVATSARWSRAVIISADPGSGHVPDRLVRDAEWARLACEGWDEFCEQWNRQGVFGERAAPWDRRGFSPQRQMAVARGFEEWSVGRQSDLRAAIRACAIPLLWVVGERDEKFVRLAASVCGGASHAELLVVEGAGHRVPWEQPEVVAEAIRSFLS